MNDMYAIVNKFNLTVSMINDLTSSNYWAGFQSTFGTKTYMVKVREYDFYGE